MRKRPENSWRQENSQGIGRKFGAKTESNVARLLDGDAVFQTADGIEPEDGAAFQVEAATRNEIQFRLP
jgi:hypothetical protein